jgi:hypothetical protein
MEENQPQEDSGEQKPPNNDTDRYILDHNWSEKLKSTEKRQEIVPRQKTRQRRTRSSVRDYCCYCFSFDYCDCCCDCCCGCCFADCYSCDYDNCVAL